MKHQTLPQIIYVRALDCEKAPDNVRTISDPAADAELEANIAETGGIIQNVIGLAIPRKKGRWHIYGGGRRLERVHANIAAGVLEEDFMLPLYPARNKAEAISMSMAENYYNLKMNPADECKGFQAVMDAQKKAPADVAKQFGVTEKFVLRRLRLANLAEPVFEALRRNEITLDVAQAYGSIADADRQAKVFEEMAESYQRTNVNEIRRRLATGSFRGGDPKAVLVGREAYLEAGGRIDPDLFADHSTELWLDGDIVERLADDRLTSAAEEIREREGYAEVRVVPATVIPYTEVSQLHEIEPEPLEMSADAAARHDEIEAALAEIARIAEEAEGYTEDQVAEIEALQAERDTLSSTGTAFTPAQKAGAVAFIMIDRDGQPKLYEEIFAVETPVEQVDEIDDPTGDEDQGDDDQGNDDDALVSPADDDEADGTDALEYSGRLRDEMAMMKTRLLALHIASDPQFALDLGTFIMADDACKLAYNSMPSELRARESSPRVSGFEDDTQAAQAWAKLDDALDRTWLNHAALEDRYDAFCTLDESARAAWLGWAIARTIQAVPHGSKGGNFLDHLGGKLAIDVASWWRPTAHNFFDRLTSKTILRLFQDIGGLDLKNRYATSRKFDLAVSAEKLFAGDSFAEPEVKARAIAWLPDPMRFATIGTRGADSTDEDDATPQPVEPPVEANDDTALTDLPQAA